MGWLSVGLLIFSGGCILYRHPPTSVIQLLSGYYKSTRGSLSQQSQAAAGDASRADEKQELERSENCSPIPIPTPPITVEQKEPDTNELQSKASDDLARATAANASQTSPPTSLNSSPRASPQAPLPSFSSMPPPPRPSNPTPLRPPPSTASSLRVPPSKALPNAAFAPSRLTAAPAKPSRKVTLKPGHSPLDWAAITSDPKNKLRGKDAPPDRLIRVPPSRLKVQNGRKEKDAWTVYQGKVYNITPYLPFHPGGEGELTRGAGRDAAKLFMEVHPWVNWEAMLGECLVGILVAEGDEQTRPEGGAGKLDEMD